MSANSLVRRVATVSLSNRQRIVKKYKKVHCLLDKLSHSYYREYTCLLHKYRPSIFQFSQGTNKRQKRRSDTIRNSFVTVSFTTKTSKVSVPVAERIPAAAQHLNYFNLLRNPQAMVQI